MTRQLILLSRGYCHLCDEMQTALERLQGRFQFALQVVDVDRDAALVAAYDEQVPVLFHSAVAMENELCHHRLNRPAVERWR